MAGYTFSIPYKPRAFAEYNYASGDRNPHDGRVGTFDQFYPTGHDKFGLADQVGWRNIRDLHFGVEARPTRAVTAALGVHSWWLASATDGLYSASGALIVRVGQWLRGNSCGRRIGCAVRLGDQQADAVGSRGGAHFSGAVSQTRHPGKPVHLPVLDVRIFVLSANRNHKRRRTVSLREFRKAGHTPTLAAAFLYFDVSFMVWVILGPGATATSPCKAQFNGKANIQDITNPLAPVSNNALQFSMTDYAPRALATRLASRSGTGPVESGSPPIGSGAPPATVEQLLEGGDLTVH